jgi:hypothetical protein
MAQTASGRDGRPTVRRERRGRISPIRLVTGFGGWK